jgi:hypothetical protein
MMESADEMTAIVELFAQPEESKGRRECIKKAA